MMSWQLVALRDTARVHGHVPNELKRSVGRRYYEVSCKYCDRIFYVSRSTIAPSTYQICRNYGDNLVEHITIHKKSTRQIRHNYLTCPRLNVML